MFIYLNRTGFNGLYRLNSKGDFNVPAGRYAKPQICDERNLRAVAEAFRSSAARLTRKRFESVLASAAAGDFLYFDPPYAPLNNTARFTSYTAGGFSDDDQRRLRDVVVDLALKGCHVVVSNSTAPLITELYATNSEARRAGLRAHIVAATRAINSDPTRRGQISEYIISNVRPERR
jgi:DNA adenine methylase